MRRGPDRLLDRTGHFAGNALPATQRFARRCGATVPEWLADSFAGLEDDDETRQMIAASIAIEQVRRLQQEGISEFHFYTLNRRS